MPLNQLWSGASPTISGYSALVQNGELVIREGYYNGSDYDYVDIGKGYVDSITHNRGPQADTVSISASNELKKLRDWKADQAYNYDSPFTYHDDFTGTVYSNRWEASGTNWSQGGSQLIGASTLLLETIFLTKKTEMRNVFAEIKGQNNTDSSQNYISLGVRGSPIADMDNVSSVTAYFSLAGNTFNLERRSNGTPTTIFTTSLAVAANTDYWIRVIAYEEKVYAFYSTNGLNYTWLGQSFGIVSGISAGMNFMFTDQGTAKYDYHKTFEYGRPYSVNTLVREVTFKSGIDNTYIPDTYEKGFSDLAGFTTFNGNWSTNASTGVLTGIGVSNAHPWGMVYSGVSFKDFTFEVEMNLGMLTYAGLMFGKSVNSFNAFWAWGNTTTTGLTLLFTQSAQELLLPGVSRFTTEVPLIIEYPYAENWYKHTIIKVNDSIQWLINDNLAYYYKGVSGFNLDSENLIGVMVFGNAGNSQMVQYRNLKIKSLDQIIPSFSIYPNSSGENALSRLQETGEFEYLMSGYTFRVVPSLNSSDSSLRTYNVGLSHTAWAIEVNRPDNLVNHVIVYGADNAIAEAWDNDLYLKTGTEKLEIVNDETINNYNDGLDLAQKTLTNRNKSRFGFNYANKAQIDLEQFDVLNIVDPNTGVSQTLRVGDFNKTYNPENGEFTQTLNLKLP